MRHRRYRQARRGTSGTTFGWPIATRRDPLVIWSGILLDGHNRYAICQKHGIQFKTVAMDFEDEDAACVWVIHNQFGRRNLQPFTRVELALKLEPLLRKRAKGNLSTGGRKGGKSKSKPLQTSAKASPPAIDTRKELAHIAHVSHDTIAKGKIILERASEEAKEALRRKKAKENQSAGGGDKKSSKRKSVPKKSAEPLETREELAHIAHVSHDTIATTTRQTSRALPSPGD